MQCHQPHKYLCLFLSFLNMPFLIINLKAKKVVQLCSNSSCVVFQLCDRDESQKATYVYFRMYSMSIMTSWIYQDQMDNV